MIKYLFIFILIVVNPYKNLNYSKINVYQLKSNDKRLFVTKPERERKKRVKYEMQLCFICNPPKYVPVEVWE